MEYDYYYYGRKTTNRLRAIETTRRQRQQPRPIIVARQLIAFGRLKLEWYDRRHNDSQRRKTTNRLRAIETRAVRAHRGASSARRKTTNRLRAIETHGSLPVL